MDDTVKKNGLALLDETLVDMGDVLCGLLDSGAYVPDDIGYAVGERLVLSVGPEEQDVHLEFFAGFVRAMPEEMLARLLLNFPLAEGSATGRVNRKLALAVADELGPDWAQTLYRLSVLVTKLA